MNNTIIATFSSADTTQKLLNKFNITGVDVLNPIAMLSRGGIRTRVEDNVMDEQGIFPEFQNRDITFIDCRTAEKLQAVEQALDNVGIEKAPFTTVGEEDEEENPLAEIEEYHRQLNGYRMMDWISRLGESSDSANSFLEMLNEENGNEDEENEFKSLTEDSIILPIHAGVVYPHMFFPDHFLTWVFFTPDHQTVGDCAGDTSVDPETIHAFVAAINLSEVSIGSGEFLLCSDYSVFSAVEGCVPGTVTIVGLHTIDNEEDKTGLSYSTWKISHNWVQALGENSAQEHLETLSEIIATLCSADSDDIFTSDNIDISYRQPQDITTSAYPYLPQVATSPVVAQTFATTLLQHITSDDEE